MVEAMGAVPAKADVAESESPLPVESSHLPLVSDLERLLQLLSALQSVCESLSQLPSALEAYVSPLVYPEV
jgi:hypothetical protein